MPITLDLNKSAEKLRLSLDKAGVDRTVKAEVVFDLDVSGSFEHEHEKGTTSVLLERLVPYGMVLDPDGKMDVFTFSGGERNAYFLGVVTPQDCHGFIRRKVVERVPGWAGGTTYSYVLERNLRHLGWLPPEEPGFLSRFFGRQYPEAPAERKRSIVIFITDGENDPGDRDRTMSVLEESQRRGDQVFFIFVGFCDTNPDFKFIRALARRFANTSAVVVQKLEEFVASSDEELNEQLVGPELVSWLKA